MSKARLIGLGVVFIWFMGGGIGHFVSSDFFVSIVPPYVSYPLEVVYLSGVFEILGALGLLLPATRRLAGLGLFMLTIAVTPANIHMWLNPALYPEVPPAFLSLRLVVQVLLLMCIWWSSKPESGCPVRSASMRPTTFAARKAGMGCHLGIPGEIPWREP